MPKEIVIVIVGILLYFILKDRLMLLFNKNVKNISANDAKEIIKEHKNMLILDVRTKEEFKNGHLPKATLIPLQQLPNRISEIEKYKNSPVMVYCQSGGRSPSAVKILLKNNFTNIYHMNRGYSTWN